MRALPALWLGVAGALSVGTLQAQTSSAPPRPPIQAERAGAAPADRPPEPALRSSPLPGAAADRMPASQSPTSPTPPSLPPPPLPAARSAPVPAPGLAVPTDNAEPLELLFIDATLAQAQQQQTLLQADGLRLLRPDAGKAIGLQFERNGILVRLFLAAGHADGAALEGHAREFSRKIRQA